VVALRKIVKKGEDPGNLLEPKIKEEVDLMIILQWKLVGGEKNGNI
jgi:hypothetical protein